jgi:cardiolipin synthase A/B
MPDNINNHYLLFNDPLRMYNAMLDDIEQAKHYIYIETYKYGNDPIGMKFRDELTKKAKQGVKIKLLIDSWGAYVSANFFSEMINYGGEVLFFKKIRLSFDFFTKNHRRNHRKLLVIDDNISYIGSANIAIHSMSWRESVLRFVGDIAIPFRQVFNEHCKLYNKYIYDKIAGTKSIKHRGFEILLDVPSTVIQPTRKKYLDLIRSAKKSIIIETPYFLPGSYMRRAIVEAAEREVEVKIIMPYRSDVQMVDILRDKYLGDLHHQHIHLLFYKPKNLHAKIFMVDHEKFIVGSSNFDYRSFRFQHEINLFGKSKRILAKLNEHIDETIQDCEQFNYEFWLRRPRIQKFFERALVPFRHLF